MPHTSRQLVFRIRGMDCAHEVAILKRELATLVGGVDRLAFDIVNAKLTVNDPPDLVTEVTIADAIAKTGMRAEIWRSGTASIDESGFVARHGLLIATVLCGVFGFAGFLTHAWMAGNVSTALGADGVGLVACEGFSGSRKTPTPNPSPEDGGGGNRFASPSPEDGGGGVVGSVATATKIPNSVIFLYLAGILAGFGVVLPKAARALARLRPDMNLLMTIAVIGAAAIGEWFEAVTVTFLFSLSLLVESWSVGRARRAIATLLDLTPPTARVRNENGEIHELTVGDVPVGASLVVRPGEKIGLDGRVEEGSSEVDQAPITGESIPVPKTVGSEVFAGTINGSGLLAIKTTKPASDTTLARIIRMVGEAQSRRAPSEQWVERFALVYTPVVMLIALAVLVIPPVAFDGNWSDWIYRSLVLLVIACPCALVISTPITIVAALASAARNGVLVKGGRFLESPARWKAIALDKTGTLTEGRPVVVDVVPFAGHTEEELLARAAAMESHSNHPLAKAIVAAADARGVRIVSADEFEIVSGKGASGRFQGKRFWLGSHRFLQERGQETTVVRDQLASMSAAGRTAVVVGHDEHVCGFIALADQVREDARRAVDDLRALGISPIAMVTGDNQGTAKAIAAVVGVDDVHAELLPEDKVRVVASLIEKHGNTAMVGDGVNDAPALARATVGIAMGAVGSDAAIEMADIALMSDDLTKLPWLVRHARRTLAVIRQNVTFALVVKAVFVGLTFAGFASLWAAIAADMGASLLVIANGLRLLAVTE